MTWRIVLEKDLDSGEYAVWCPELPGCISAGRTVEEARQNIREAILLFLEETPLELGTTAQIDQIAV